MDSAMLEQRITRLEDIEAIKQLKARYCEICDDNHNPDLIATLFADDGVWDSGEPGLVARGHDAIRELFRGVQRVVEFSQHMVMNPVIEVDGDRARGQWYNIAPFNFYDRDEPATWVAARYDEEYVKVNGVWKFQELHVRARLNTGVIPTVPAEAETAG
jgi:hypothetical protein